MTKINIKYKLKGGGILLLREAHIQPVLSKIFCIF